MPQMCRSCVITPREPQAPEGHPTGGQWPSYGTLRAESQPVSFVSRIPACFWGLPPRDMCVVSVLPTVVTAVCIAGAYAGFAWDSSLLDLFVYRAHVWAGEGEFPNF